MAKNREWCVVSRHQSWDSTCQGGQCELVRPMRVNDIWLFASDLLGECPPLNLEEVQRVLPRAKAQRHENDLDISLPMSPWLSHIGTGRDDCHLPIAR
jgi:hypothetical protein